VSHEQSVFNSKSKNATDYTDFTEIYIFKIRVQSVKSVALLFLLKRIKIQDVWFAAINDHCCLRDSLTAYGRAFFMGTPLSPGR